MIYLKVVAWTAVAAGATLVVVGGAMTGAAVFILGGKAQA